LIENIFFVLYKIKILLMKEGDKIILKIDNQRNQ